jgi:hypothetical protein
MIGIFAGGGALCEQKRSPSVFRRFSRFSTVIADPLINEINDLGWIPREPVFKP